MSYIEIFTTEDSRVQLNVSLDGETVWLSQAQMVELFSRERSVITKHINNVFRDGELDEKSNVQNMHIANSDKPVKFFNLDVVISVGYRVKSPRGVQFRKWATNVLKQHLIQGYTLNDKRLAERNIEVNQVLSLLSSTLRSQSLVNDKGDSVLQVICEYARSWSLLQGYDEQSLPSNRTVQPSMAQITLKEALEAISSLKTELIKKGEATDLFGQLRGDGLASALATIEQGFGDELFYPNVATRASHLLYFVIKNHPLADGNKRSGSFLFLWYLRLNQSFLAKPVEQLINDNALVALALLIAESKPEQKALMIRLIEHFLPLK